MTRPSRPVPEWTPAVAAGAATLLAELAAHGYTEAGICERLDKGLETALVNASPQWLTDLTSRY